MILRTSLFFLLAPLALFSSLFDPSLIEPYSYRVIRKEPYDAPFIAVYHNQTHTIAFLASQHASSLKSPTFRTVEKAINEFAPDCIIVEGVSYEQNFNTRPYIQKAKEESATSFEYCSEIVYAIYLAHQNSIRFVGGEPSHTTIYEEMLKWGYAPDDFFGFYIVRQIPQWNLEKKEPTKERIEDFISLYSKIISRSTTMNYSKFLTWYQEKTGSQFIGSQITTKTTFPTVKGSFIQTLAHQVTALRDIELLNTLEKMVNSHQRILVIYGSSHHAVNRKALESVFGKADFLKWY